MAYQEAPSSPAIEGQTRVFREALSPPAAARAALSALQSDACAWVPVQRSNPPNSVAGAYPYVVGGLRFAWIAPAALTGSMEYGSPASVPRKALSDASR